MLSKAWPPPRGSGFWLVRLSQEEKDPPPSPEPQACEERDCPRRSAEARAASEPRPASVSGSAGERALCWGDAGPPGRICCGLRTVSARGPGVAGLRALHTDSWGGSESRVPRPGRVWARVLCAADAFPRGQGDEA